MATPETNTIKTVLQEFANSEISKLRGSVGREDIYQRIMQFVPNVEEAVVFINRCRVAGAQLILVAGDTPLVRVKLRSGKKTRTVNPVSWLVDVLILSGFLDGPTPPHVSHHVSSLSVPNFVPYFKKLVSNLRIAELDLEIKNAQASTLADEAQVSSIKGRLAKKREIERKRLIRSISQLFASLPPNFISEDDVIRLFRENQVKSVLDE